MDVSVEESTWAMTFVSLLFLAGMIRGLVWIIQFKNQQEDRNAGMLSDSPAALSERIPERFMISARELVIFLAVVTLMFLIQPLLAFIAATIGGMVLLNVRGVNALTLWNFKVNDLPSYLVNGLDRYLLLSIPILLIMLTSSVFFRVLGYDDLAQPAIKEFMESDSMDGVVGIVIFAVVVAPIWEEILFRGILYPLLRGWGGVYFAVVVSGGLFGLIHQHAPTFVSLTFFGMALAWFYERTGKLGCCIVLHAALNGATVIGLLLVKYAP